jgi:hypothetical protein
LQWEQDSLNPGLPDRANMMVLSPENDKENDDPHPYWYAWILGIYHAHIRHVGPSSKSLEPNKMDFLFVHWFGCDADSRPGWKAKHLLRLGFVPGRMD